MRLRRPASKKALAAVAVGGLLAGVGTGALHQALTAPPVVGVLLPGAQEAPWTGYAADLEDALTAAHLRPEVRYAAQDGDTQVEQIAELLDDGVDALILDPVSGATLTSALEPAAAAKVPVVSYRTLVRDSAAVTLHVGFDEYGTGQAQMASLLDALGVVDEDGAPVTGAGPFTMELFAGSPERPETALRWQGAFDMLEPFLAADVVQVRSGQTAREQVAILEERAAATQARTEILLGEHYADVPLDAVLSPDDTMTQAIVTAFAVSGAHPALVTGGGGTAQAAAAIQDGRQLSTVVQDPRALAGAAAQGVADLLGGRAPHVTDADTTNNGAAIVPAILVPPLTVTADNLDELPTGSQDAASR